MPSDTLERLESACAAIALIHMALVVRGTADGPMAPVLGADRTSRPITAVLGNETINALRDVADLLRSSRMRDDRMMGRIKLSTACASRNQACPQP